MRTTLLALSILAPALALGQSLAEVAKKERTRREKNRQEGREVQVLSESDLGSGSEETGTASGTEEGAAPATGANSSYVASSRESTEESTSESESEEDASLPAFIPPDAPLPEKLDLFERMKRQYQRQAQEIDEAIAKNDTRLRELEAEIGAASALGGAGLPVAPQAGTGAATRPMTGQESATLVGEQNRLQEANAQLRARKEELKMNLQAKGRAAGIPPGYLRF
jgi:hypothetical protein